MKLVHGGDTVGYRERYGHDALDFSANVSPLGVPEAVARAIGEAAFQADQYPDPLCRALTAALSQTEAVPKAWILCGNGAADLIFRLALAEKPKHALVLAPTFAEYAAALERGRQSRGKESGRIKTGKPGGLPGYGRNRTESRRRLSRYWSLSAGVRPPR